MDGTFIKIYKLFSNKKWLFISTIAGIIIFISFFVYNLKIEENINAILPKDEKIDEINLALENSKFADQIILNFSLNDTNDVNADLLREKASNLVALLEKDTVLIKKINFKIDESSFQNVYDFFYDYLPFYLSDDDYKHLDSILRNKDKIEKELLKDLKSLISPAGIATKKFIFKDPFSITPLALKKLKNFKLDDNFIIYNSCIFTKDKKNLLVFVEPKNKSVDIDKNKVLVQNIENNILKLSNDSSSVNIEYYGGTAVAVANAKRIKLDIMLTVSIALIIIFILFLLFFKRVKVLVLLFIPVILGAGIAISVISIVSGEVSAIALGIGAVLVGISIDYSLHVFTHFRSSGSITQTIKDVTMPIIMSSVTTSSAFLCLFVIKSEALNQLGMFGAFSVFFSALIVLLIIPYLLSRKGFSLPKTTKLSFLDKISSYDLSKNKIVVITIIILSIVFSFSARNIEFNGDIASMNYLPAHLAKAENNLKKISSETLSAVYLITVGETLEEALSITESKQAILKEAKSKNLFSSMSSGSDLILTKKLQQEKINKWNNFWNSIDRDTLKNIITNKAPQFKENAFNEFYSLINKEYKPINLDGFSVLQKSFLGNYINKSNNNYSVVSILKVDKKDKAELFAMFENQNDIIIFDKQYFSNQFIEVLTKDFNKLVLISMLIVFILLQLSFGRLEFAIISFVPILLSWLWTLGLMGLFGLKFNIFNIIISTFIFGLGVDYSIFIMNGLANNYKFGNHSIAPYKLSVLLSVITTVLGIGVLIFAQHPALKSIALVSIFGISSVVLITYTILPLLFNLITTHNGKLRKEPLTLTNSLISVFSLLLFILEAVILTILIPVFYILPLPRKTVKYIYHSLISASSKFIVWINYTIKKEVINKNKLDFSKPTVIVSNHQSHLDLVLILRLNPKIIAITNKWVWNNPIYGFVLRFANYYPIYNGIEADFDKLRKKVSQGYSILVFPEGSRTVDGSIKRYHQGAFKLADELNLDIQPILIHGAYQCLPKNEFFMRSGRITQKIFDKVQVKHIDLEKGETYREQAKELTQLMREEFNSLAKEKENPDFYRSRLVNQFIYKGPVVEWYTKVKTKVEGNYKFFNDVIPLKANIVDIGCGYGYLGMMLRYISNDRIVTGLDYDAEKIGVASRISENDDGINFIVKDIIEGDMPKADVYILNDVLHYMPEDLQIKVLENCFNNVSEKGMVIVRDADADLENRTKVTKATEIQSTKIFKFNKTQYDLSFISGKVICDTAEKNNFTCERIDNTILTSNITYIIRDAR